jgi:hypothetical protein
MNKKIRITEEQLKMVVKTVNKEKTKKVNEQLDMADDPRMEIKVGMAVISHLSDIQEMGISEDANDRINFIKKLVMKFPDMKQTISTDDLDAIYDEMLGRNKNMGDQSSLGGDTLGKKEDVKNISNNPFPDGYDFSVNESVKKIKDKFKRFL